jgi:hypothetical protein
MRLLCISEMHRTQRKYLTAALASDYNRELGLPILEFCTLVIATASVITDKPDFLLCHEAPDVIGLVFPTWYRRLDISPNGGRDSAFIWLQSPCKKEFLYFRSIPISSCLTSTGNCIPVKRCHISLSLSSALSLVLSRSLSLSPYVSPSLSLALSLSLRVSLSFSSSLCLSLCLSLSLSLFQSFSFSLSFLFLSISLVPIPLLEEKREERSVSSSPR